MDKYRVIIEKFVNQKTNSSGEGSSVEVALKRAKEELKKEMEEKFGEGIADELSFNYAIYEKNPSTKEWKFLRLIFYQPESYWPSFTPPAGNLSR